MVSRKSFRNEALRLRQKKIVNVNAKIISPTMLACACLQVTKPEKQREDGAIYSNLGQCVYFNVSFSILSAYLFYDNGGTPSPTRYSLSKRISRFLSLFHRLLPSRHMQPRPPFTFVRNNFFQRRKALLSKLRSKSHLVSIFSPLHRLHLLSDRHLFFSFSLSPSFPPTKCYTMSGMAFGLCAA